MAEQQFLYSLAVQKAHASQTETAPKERRLKFGENELETPICFSFLSLTELDEASTPRWPEVDSPRDGVVKFDGRCLRLNNNQLKSVSSLHEFVQRTFTTPDNLGWLDLSHNRLTTIDEVILQFKELQILYLHGNEISNLKEIDKLAKLPKLRKLTLHGNPIDQDKNYLLYVTSTLPQLKNISFSAVTNCQAATATSFKRMNKGTKKKGKAKREDD